jgi:hypothetical protein
LNQVRWNQSKIFTPDFPINCKSNVGQIMSVEKAPPELQLAVDLIYLLECNEIAPETALAALAIVQLDYQRKLRRQNSD